MTKACGHGRYVIGCRNHPGIVVETFFDHHPLGNNDVTVKSLIDGTLEACSLRHCGVEPISKEMAEAQAQYYIKHGPNAVWAKFYPDTLKEWIEAWHEIRATGNEKDYGFDIELHEYLDFTLEEYDRLIVRGEVP